VPEVLTGLGLAHLGPRDSHKRTQKVHSSGSGNVDGRDANISDDVDTSKEFGNKISTGIGADQNAEPHTPTSRANEVNNSTTGLESIEKSSGKPKTGSKERTKRMPSVGFGEDDHIDAVWRENGGLQADKPDPCCGLAQLTDGISCVSASQAEPSQSVSVNRDECKAEPSTGYAGMTEATGVSQSDESFQTAESKCEKVDSSMDSSTHSHRSHKSGLDDSEHQMETLTLETLSSHTPTTSTNTPPKGVLPAGALGLILTPDSEITLKSTSDGEDNLLCQENGNHTEDGDGDNDNNDNYDHNEDDDDDGDGDDDDDGDRKSVKSVSNYFAPAVFQVVGSQSASGSAHGMDLVERTKDIVDEMQIESQLRSNDYANLKRERYSVDRKRSSSGGAQDKKGRSSGWRLSFRYEDYVPNYRSFKRNDINEWRQLFRPALEQSYQVPT
jgi:hypothetical protein